MYTQLHAAFLSESCRTVSANICTVMSIGLLLALQGEDYCAGSGEGSCRQLNCPRRTAEGQPICWDVSDVVISVTDGVVSVDSATYRRTIVREQSRCCCCGVFVPDAPPVYIWIYNEFAPGMVTCRLQSKMVALIAPRVFHLWVGQQVGHGAVLLQRVPMSGHRKLFIADFAWQLLGFNPKFCIFCKMSATVFVVWLDEAVTKCLFFWVSFFL